MKNHIYQQLITARAQQKKSFAVLIDPDKTESRDLENLILLGKNAKVAYVPGTAFYADGFGSWSMRLSYCHPTPERIREGVKALGQVVKQEMGRRGSALN